MTLLRNVALAAGLLLAATTAQAADPIDPDRLAAARRTVAVLEEIQIQMRPVLDAVAESMPEKRRAEFYRRAERQASPERVEQVTAEVMARVFTVEELDAMTGFYSTPAGRSATAKTPVYTAELLTAMRQLFQEAAKE